MARPLFLAAPERGAAAVGLIDKLLVELQFLTGGAVKASDWFVPHLQVGDVGVEVDAATWFQKSLAALGDARVVVVVLDGAQVDENVAFLLGYAFAAGKPCIGITTDGRAKGPLAEGALRALVHDARGLAGALGTLLREPPERA